MTTTGHFFTARPVNVAGIGRRVVVACACGLGPVRVTHAELADLRRQHAPSVIGYGGDAV